MRSEARTSVPSSTVPNREALHRKASEAVMRDLVDALLRENLMGIAEEGTVTASPPEPLPPVGFDLAEDERYFGLRLNGGRTLLFRVRPRRVLQPYALARPPIQLVGAEGEPEEPDPVGLVEILFQHFYEKRDHDPAPNLSGFLAELSDAIRHTALALEAAHALEDEDPGRVAPFLRTERLSSLRDRPFHPTSKAKRGWGDDEYRRFGPEFGREFGLDWVALRRDYVEGGSETRDAAGLVLKDPELRSCREAMEARGLDGGEYLALPVHPWQMERVLPSVYREEMEQGVCVPLCRGLGSFVATSSVRALSPSDGGARHVKVPLGIYSLGALRTLPPHYLRNGEKGQRMLELVIEGDPLLEGRLHLCDEGAWWGFQDPAGDPFDDKPGHLGCLVREYPRRLIEDEEVELVAMSALAAPDASGGIPAFSGLLAVRGGVGSEESQVLGLFGEICGWFVEAALGCFRHGIMPEVHGQNVLLAARKGRVEGLVLRDHDTIRLHLPWLEREGLRGPGYVIKPGTRNTLINGSPEELLSYFQTLGVQVNLYAIADALSRAYSMDEAAFWAEIRSAVEAALRELPRPMRTVAEDRLLRSRIWPTRTLISPLLARAGSGGASMPAGIGETLNPLRGW